MRSSRTTEVPLKKSAQLFTDPNIGTEWTTAWKTLPQSKAALRHIENRLEATPGTGALLDSVTISPKKKTSRTSRNRDGQQADVSRGTSKPKRENQQSPAKSNSRSPLRNATQDSNVRKNSSVEFREPLASYREATPPSHPFSQLEAYNLQAVPGSSYTSYLPYSEPLSSQLIYQRDTRDLDSTHSSALESAEVRYLNDQPVLDSLRTEQDTHKAQLVMDNRESNSFLARTPGSSRQGESTPSTSPGSVSQRLENLRRHQPDDKLEKLKERIRRQRQHLEENADREKLQGCLEKPIVQFGESDNVGSSSMPAAKIRKVTAAPPAPIYKGFNSIDAKIQTPDGKVWKEEDFSNFSREIYRDLSCQFPESSKSRHQQLRADKSKERRPSKPVRKVHKVAPISEQNSKPVIGPASWREGQKLVKMVLGPPLKPPREEHSSHPAGRPTRTVSRHHSDSHSEQKRHSRPNSTERPYIGFQDQAASRSTTSYNPSSPAQDKMPRGGKTGVLSVDIQGILDDLQLDCKPDKMEERARKRTRGGSGGRRGGSGSRTRAPVSAWGTTSVANRSSTGCRSASPTTHQPDSVDGAGKSHKKRHYDADTVRQYIAQQQEERKRRQAEEKRAVKEEAERRNQRLQELYKKQREVAKTVTLTSEAVVAPVQKRLQETYTKLLLEDSRLDSATPAQRSAPFIQMRPMYQPSGESDKENKRMEVSQSPSSSDKSLNEQPPPPLSRNDLEVTSLLQPDHLNPALHPTDVATSSVQVPSNEHLLSQLLRLEAAIAASNRKYTDHPATAPRPQSQTRMSRIEVLKAKAASLSNRIETEARRFAGQGINYGAATSVDVDIVLPPRNSNLDVDHWTETAAHVAENTDMSFRVQKAFASAGNTSYTGAVLPGAGNLHDFNENCEKPHSGSPGINGATTNSYAQERWRIVGDLEERTEKVVHIQKDKKVENLVYPYQTDLHDSSAGSISEGPLLSEGSLSEEDGSPPHYSSNRGPNSDYLEAVDCSAGKRSSNQRLFDFQREAAKCSALSPPFSQLNGSKAPWEELNKGSPLSVINIFTKNSQGLVKVSERPSERNSPPARSSRSGNEQGEAAVYEDDFVSSHSSRTSSQLQRGSHSPSHSQRISPGSTPGSSPLSRHSTSKKATISDLSDATLVEEQRTSPLSETFSSDHKKRASDRSLSQAQAKSADSETVGELSAHSPLRSKLVSSSASPDLSSSLTADSLSEHGRRGSYYPTTSSRAESRSTGELQYSPAVLQQRMAAELHYLESIEESIKQLGDVEKLMGVSMAQQESASLAQMLKAKQQRHEREIYELKIKTEREALEAKLQLEENRQRVARAHLELQENLAASQKQTLEGIQESTSKMMSQQAEAARHTADAARHIKEMADLARSQITGHLIIPPVAVLDHQEEQHSSYTNPQENSADSKSFKSEISHRRARSGEPSSLQNSLSQSDSLSLRRPNISGSLSGSSQTSPLHAPSDHRERLKREAGERKQRNERAEERRKGEAASSSIEDDIPTAANESLCSESIPSVGDEKGETTSVATEYSLKFDESMTEDEIEERSFRSLLPSEAHRRGTMEKKSHQQKEAEEGGACPDETLVPETGSCSSFKSHDAHIAFSGGQDSFSQFTMEMVRQYMRDEEVRLQHQSSLLHLRQKALKEKTRTELAWLEHQKKKLRDKGEDDKMPPIRKKQRGLLLKLQQEQAEIKRLQEANKAARKERQLLLKQQEEIERMRNSTLRLKERLKCAEGEAPPETLVSEPSGSELSSQRLPDEIRSPSPSLSISGSETSSIMAKLKKMRSHMDEKFLTKREQQLMQRRHHAEELLQWKQQLDQEEAEVRRMEKEALAVWDQRRQDKDHKTSESHRKEISETGSKASHHQCLESRSDSEKDLVSEDNCSSITTESSVHTEGAASQHQLSPSSEPRPASVAETPLASVQSSKATYTQDFSTESQLPAKSSSLRGSHSPSASPLDSSSKTKMQLRSTSQAQSEVFPQVLNAATAMQSENISDQSDIECRIKALREELRKRKIMAYQLKKEQKKRHKERLKAQEANLLKKLENYNNFIEKTKAELNKEPGSTPDTSHRNESNYILEQSSLKHSQQRTDINTSSAFDGTLIDASQDHSSVPQSYQSRTASKATPEDFPNDLAKTPSGIKYSRPESDLLSEPLLRSPTKLESEDDKALSDLRSDIEEELDVEVKSRSEDEVSHHHLLQLDSQEKLIASDHVPPFTDGEHDQSLPLSLDQDEQKKRSKISEAEETPYSAAVNLETSPHTSRRSSHTDRPLSPESVGLSLNKDPLLKDVDPSTGTDGYHKDFESANSSPREEHISRHESQICVPHVDIKHSSKESSKATSASDHEVEEEEIPEEMSQHSGESEESHHSEKLLELQLKEDDLKFDTKTEFSSQAPGSPPVIMDEMPSFHLGDRVLIGGVQPGTLRFKGPTSFANGFWAGVELDKSEGRNNGTYDGVVYFECKESHGIFAPPDKVSHLPDKFELYTDTTEDEDSFFDDLPDKGGKKHKKVKGSSQKQEGPDIKNEQTSDKKTKSRTEKVSDEKDQIPPKTKPYLNSQHQKEPEHQLCNGNIKDIILDFNDASSTFLTPDKHGIEENEETTAVINKIEVDNKQDLIPTDQTREVKTDRREQKEDLLDTFTDKLLNNFIKDSFYQCAEIKRAKEEKIKNANQLNECLFDGNNEEKWLSSLEQKDNLPFFLPAEKEELSSPELCNRSESPVFGPSGQEELAKRLAELELSRELLDDLGDDQDWFDEDFGLSSRRQQQRLKQKEELQGELGRSASSSGPHMGGMVSSLGGESQVKTPPRPELPLPLPPKLPEQPAMVVPHSATEVEKMVQSATLEIWETFDLGKEGSLILEQHPKPTPSLEYLGKESSSQDQKALSVSSYKKAVYDLTWEILKEIFAEDPNTDQPQWVKTRQVKSTSIHRVKTSGDIKKIQEFVAEEVLKLYGLTQDESQKSDWQKMLKFGRKKRDRVDHILVQELHEEEAQWVNYDEDELFVKIQLADSIFEALLKDTASTFTLISDKRSKRGALS